MVEGLACYGSRVFVSLSDKERNSADNRFAVAAFFFRVDGDGHGDLSESAEICLFDGAGSMLNPPDDFPGAYLDGGQKMQVLDIAPGMARLYVGTKNGYVVELDYRDSPESLTARSFWRSLTHHQEILDNHAYNLAPYGQTPDIRVLAAQYLETFALIAPPPGW